MVKVRFFAILREKAGVEELFLPISGTTTVEQILEDIKDKAPAVAPLISDTGTRVAVNHEFARLGDSVKDGDEVALIPPVSGGSGPLSASSDRLARLVRIQRDDFSVDETINLVKETSTSIGGIAVFLGTVRDISAGRDVDWLKFEHYPGMAEAKLREIRERALSDFDIIEASIIHRFGRVDIGDNIVLIVIGAGHRDAAFKACRFCIDELKQITPIWKKEVSPSGDFWVEPHP